MRPAKGRMSRVIVRTTISLSSQDKLWHAALFKLQAATGF